MWILRLKKYTLYKFFTLTIVTCVLCTCCDFCTYHFAFLFMYGASVSVFNYSIFISTRRWVVKSSTHVAWRVYNGYIPYCIEYHYTWHVSDSKHFLANTKQVKDAKIKKSENKLSKTTGLWKFFASTRCYSIFTSKY